LFYIKNCADFPFDNGRAVSQGARLLLPRPSALTQAAPHQDKNRGTTHMKTFLVYLHLIAACVAIGILFIQDLALSKLRGRPMAADAIDELHKSGGIVFVALVVLWVTGLGLVVLGYLDNPAYLMNQKLWAKFTVVSILTLNGLLLHYYSFPQIVSAKGFIGQGLREQLVILVTAVISVVSWLYACYLGIARPWNNVAPYAYVMTIYAACMGLALLIALEYWRGLRNVYLIYRAR
jgi:hypothetical protein